MTYLTHLVVPRASSLAVRDLRSVTTSLFPSDGALDKHACKEMLENKACGPPIPALGKFLELRGLVFDDTVLIGVSAVLKFLLAEVLELANNCSRDHARKVLLPLDIRLAVVRDPELLALFSGCRPFWPPPFVESVPDAPSVTF